MKRILKMNVNEAAPEKSIKSNPPELEFRRLSTECRLGAFCCGENDIDNWFRNKALNEHQKLRARVVTAHLINNVNPCGFYALSINIESEKNFIGKEKSLFSWASRNGYLASVHLCWIGVLKPMQRQGIGTVIMGHALNEFYETVIRTGIAALTLTSY